MHGQGFLPTTGSPHSQMPGLAPTMDANHAHSKRLRVGTGCPHFGQSTMGDPIEGDDLLRRDDVFIFSFYYDSVVTAKLAG